MRAMIMITINIKISGVNLEVLIIDKNKDIQKMKDILKEMKEILDNLEKIIFKKIEILI